MTTINNVGMNGVNNVNFQGTDSAKKTDNKPSDDKKMKTATKLMIGATALAAAVVGGVIFHKVNVAKKAAQEAEKLAKDLNFERGRMSRLFKDNVKEEELASKLEEIDKLSPAEQKQAYEVLDKVYTNITHDLRYAQKYGEDKVVLRRGMKELPQDVKKEMADGNWIKAGELYEAHVHELPNTFKAKNIGSTVEESISNVFGAEAKVKPHTYDLANEGTEILSLRNCGGYYDVIATKEGILYEGAGKTSLNRAISNADKFQDKAIRTAIGDKATVIHGVDKEGKYVTILNMTDKNVDTSGRGLTINLGMISNGKNPSPAQKDLLSLAKNPEKFDETLIDALTLKTNPEVTGAENLDYNLALSVIQSMAKG